MRFNSMARDNEIKFDYSRFIFYAVALAFASAIFIYIGAKVIVVVFELGVKYWWATIIIILVWIFFKRRRRKK